MAKTIKRKPYSPKKSKSKIRFEWKVIGFLLAFFTVLGIGIFAFEKAGAL